MQLNRNRIVTFQKSIGFRIYLYTVLIAFCLRMFIYCDCVDMPLYFSLIIVHLEHIWILPTSFSGTCMCISSCWIMMTSSNGNIFRVTGPLCVEFTGRWPVNSPHNGQWRGALMFSLICAWIICWVSNREASDLRRDRAHYDFSL